MTTYESYEAAKIANPDADIFVSNVGKFHAVKESPTSHFANGWKLCNPEDHCMTVEQFDDLGHELSDGDLYIGRGGFVVELNERKINSLLSKDLSVRYILRAAALEEKEKPFLQTGEDFEHTKTLNFIHDRMINVHGENSNVDYMHKFKNAIMMVEKVESNRNEESIKEEKPKSVKVSYEKVEFNHAWEAVKYIEDGGSFFVKKTEGLSPFWVEITHLQGGVADWKFAHRRVETETSERDEFVGAVCSLCDEMGIGAGKINWIAKALFDSGKFKLVEGERYEQA